ISAQGILDAGAADALVIKPMRLGGLRHSLAVADTALRHGVALIVTSSLDGAIGRAGALHVAGAIEADPRVTRHQAHGLATGSLLLEDLADDIEPRDGWLRPPNSPGLGIRPRLPLTVSRAVDPAPSL